MNVPILAALLEMTAGHCAYCDGWPLDATGEPTIDHFRPKSRFRELAYDWDNLFPACERRQGHRGKADRWDERAMKPDHAGYRFAEVFRYIRATGELVPNPDASDEIRASARATIDLFGLNGGSRREERKRASQVYASYETRPYRFVFDEAW